MSERAIGSGQTKPSELIALIRRGVPVHPVHNLHAKVFVLGDRAVVGSSNASRSSANGLIEAALVTRDRGAIAECRKFVESLTGEPVDLRHARDMQKLYKPPEFGAPGKKGNGIAPAHSRFWIAPLFRDATDLEYEEAEKGTGRATGRMKEPKRSRLGWFGWSGPKSSRQAKNSHRKGLDPLVQRLGQRAAKLKSQKNVVALKDALLVHDLMRLWT
jgi:hypothetical protein